MPEEDSPRWLKVFTGLVVVVALITVLVWMIRVFV